MGLVRTLKDGIAEAQQLAGRPIEGAGGLTVTQDRTGVSVANERWVPVAPDIRVAVIVDSDGTDTEDTPDDFDDERYYLCFATPVTGNPTDAVSLSGDPQRYHPLVEVGTNLAEQLYPGGAGGGFHGVPIGTPVATWQEEDEDGNPRWVFFHPVHALRVVLVVKTGGVAGSATTNCTWVYKLKDLLGVDIPGATGLTPARPRYPNCQYNQPADGSPGLAWVDAGGVWQLYEAVEEIPTTDEVTIAAGNPTWSEPTLTFPTKKLLVLEDRGTGTPFTFDFSECTPP